MGQADPILSQLGAGPAVKKLVETALILSNSPDAQQRNHAYAFMESAIKELEGEDSGKSPQGHLEHDQNEPVSPVQEEHEDEDEHKIHEEELSNNNQGGRTTGSEQSTENEEPYPGTARDSTNGEKPMQDMSKTQNQWNEIGGMPPGMQPGMGGMPGMGEMPNGGGMIMPGLSPDIAQEMGMGMPQMPPMDTNQMMRQMQYTLNDYHKKIVGPMTRLVKQQKEAITQLSKEIRETKTYNGSMKLDLDSLKKNATVKFRETEPTIGNLSSFDSHGIPGIQPVPNRQRNNLSNTRSEIEEMDRILRTQNSIYN